DDHVLLPGPYENSVACNPAKLLLDPYARALHGTVRFGPEVLGYSASSPDASSDADSTASVPRSLVMADESFPWHGNAILGLRPPR
ncbi:MAG: hypothetical protein WBF20_18480, partial [Trebonia sp.]